MIENWKKIDNCSFYEVSNLGNIRSYKNPKNIGSKRLDPVAKKTVITNKGYRRVGLINDNGVQKMYSVSRLVAKAFLETRDESLDVAHIDGNKNNNSVGNLKWCSHKENISHKKIHQTNRSTYGETSHLSKLTEAEIVKIRELLSAKVGHRKIGLLFGTSRANIGAIHNRKTWKHVV